MIDAQTRWSDWRDEFVEFIYPSHLRMMRSKGLAPNEPGIAYFSEPPRKKEKLSGSVSFEIYPPGSDYIQRHTELVLQALQGPEEWITGDPVPTYQMQWSAFTHYPPQSSTTF